MTLAARHQMPRSYKFAAPGRAGTPFISSGISPKSQAVVDVSFIKTLDSHYIGPKEFQNRQIRFDGSRYSLLFSAKKT